MRLVTGAICVVSISFLQQGTPAYAQCGPCQPSVGGILSGEMQYVYIDPAISGNALTDLQTAFGAVNGQLSGLRGMVDYAFEKDGHTVTEEEATIKVYKVALGAGIGGDTIANGRGGGYMRLNSQYVDGGNRALFWNIATHEVMHTANFHDVYTAGCGSQTQMFKPIPENGPYANGPTSTDVCAADRVWRGGESPIIISLTSGWPRLSNLENGVLFDIRAEGVLDLVAWPTDDREGLLALDRNANGQIDSGAELFGNHTPLANGADAENGYEALKEFDANHDFWIDRRDAVYSHLRLWIDRNRDGLSQPDELYPLHTVGILALSLQYRTSRHVDPWGNEFRYHAPVMGRGFVHESWDVYLRDGRP